MIQIILNEGGYLGKEEIDTIEGQKERPSMDSGLKPEGESLHEQSN